MKNLSEHVATENSTWHQHVSTCLNHMTAVLREKTSLMKVVPSCHLRVGPLESEGFPSPEVGVHYMWGSDMVFPEPSRLKPCLTSWVTPFQTLQLHEKFFRTCGHRELNLASTCLNMSQPHDCCLKRKDIAGESCATLPSGSWTTRIWRLPITWSKGVHYMWGSDMVFPEPSILKPCLTSWVTPFQTLQLHDTFQNMWPLRTQTGINMSPHVSTTWLLSSEKRHRWWKLLQLPFCHPAIWKSGSWTTRIWRLPITWSWGVHYMWGSDVVFPEPSMLKPCPTSWVTPLQTLQLHKKSFRTCGHRELKLESTCLNMSQPHDCCLKRKDITGESCAILPSESWTTRIWRLPITWSWGVQYMWGSDMVFPEPSMLKPCLTSWVTPFQTLQLHEKSFRTCGHRELNLASTCLNMSQPHDSCLKRKDITGENRAILPSESWTTRIWRLPINPAVLDCWVSRMYQGVTRGKGLQWSYLVHAVRS